MMFLVGVIDYFNKYHVSHLYCKYEMLCRRSKYSYNFDPGRKLVRFIELYISSDTGRSAEEAYAGGRCIETS